jgi:excisionase family DNA binding protein
VKARLFIDPPAAADRLGMKESRLRKLAQAGKIPHHRDGRFLRFTEDDLAAYVESTRVGPKNPYQTSRG